MAKRVSIFLALCVALSLFAGCFTITQMESSEQITLYVQHSNKASFMQEYGIAYEIQHPDVKIEVLDPEYSGERKPDLLHLATIETYRSMIREGQLAPLDSYMQRDIRELEQYLASPGHARAIEILQSVSDQALYAMPIGLLSEVLFYNKDLFDQYQVPYPTDYMTWEEVIQLAQHFPTENEDGEPLYGLSTYIESLGPFIYITDMANARNLPMIDEVNRIVTMDTPEWREIWEHVIPAMQAGHIHLTLEGMVENHPFDQGQAAMIHSNLSTAYRLEKQKDSDKYVNWDMVTLPLNPRKEPKTSSYILTSAYGIPIASQHKEEAWDLLKFILNRNQPPTELAGRSLEPLYALEYDSEPGHDPMYWGLLNELRRLASEELMLVVQGEKTIDDALQSLQANGQVLLDQFWMERKMAEGEHK